MDVQKFTRGPVFWGVLVTLRRPGPLPSGRRSSRGRPVSVSCPTTLDRHANDTQQHAATRNDMQRHATTRNDMQRYATTRNNIQQHATTCNDTQRRAATSNNTQQHATTCNNMQRPLARRRLPRWGGAGAAREDHSQLGRRRRHIVEARVTQPGWSRPAGGIGDFGRASRPYCSPPSESARIRCASRVRSAARSLRCQPQEAGAVHCCGAESEL